MQVYIALPVICLVLLLSFNDWRFGVKAALIAVFLEGALRKWIFPQAQEYIYFYKDIILLCTYSGYLMDSDIHNKFELRLNNLKEIISIVILIGFLQIFNFNLPNKHVGLLGFKSYFIYMPLLVMVPHLFANKAAMLKYLRIYILLAIPAGILAFIQFYAPVDSIINYYVATDMDIATFGYEGYVRVTSFFPYLTGFGTFLMFTSMLVLGLLHASEWRFKNNMFIYIALLAVVLSMFMTGSRTPIYMFASSFIIYIFYEVYRGYLRGNTLAKIIFAVLITVLTASYFASDAIKASVERATAAQDEESRYEMLFLMPFNFLEVSGLTGYGIGATHNAAPQLARDVSPYSWLPDLYFEDEPGRIMLDLGLIGFCVIITLRISIAYYAYYIVKTLHDEELHALALAIFLFLSFHIVLPIVSNPTAGVYYWFLSGLLLLLRRLDRDIRNKHLVPM